MSYYAWAVLQLPADAPPPIVVVPSGNLGNVTAGLLAARRGVPIARFVAATTVNDPLPRFLATGRYEPSAAVATLANAMDVGHPSNFERLQWLFQGNLEAMRRDVVGVAVTDDEIRTALRDMASHGYLADPHTAVGWVGARKAAADVDAAVPRVILATAHPAKFGDVVGPVLGRDIPLPPALAERMAQPPSSWPASASLPALTAILERIAS
jgi:threonine synthase